MIVAKIGRVPKWYRCRSLSIDHVVDPIFVVYLTMSATMPSKYGALRTLWLEELIGRKRLPSDSVKLVKVNGNEDWT